MVGIIVAILCEYNVKVSTIENESETAEARGGQGNPRLMTWDYSRTSTLTMQDALISDISLAMLAGTQMKDDTNGIEVVGRETLTIVDNAGTPEVTLSKTPLADSVKIMVLEDGVMTGEELTAGTITGNAVEVTGGTLGDSVLVFYSYEVTGEGATQVTFTGKDFPATYKIVGDTVIRGEDGIDRKAQFVVPKGKLQSSFSLTMDVENVSTFDFNVDVLVDKQDGDKLYHIVRLNDKGLDQE